MRSLVLLLLVSVLGGCGGRLEVGEWKGTWSGAAVINTGRQPEIYNGTITIDALARFEAVSVAIDGKVFTCALTASEIEDTAASFTAPLACTMTANPADDCTYEVTFNNASATRDGKTLQGVANGRMTSTCTVSSSKALDFALTISATRN